MSKRAMEAVVRCLPPLLARQLLLYAVVGGAQLVLDYAVFVALTYLDFHVVVANVVARISGACLGYWLNRSFTFKPGEQGYELDSGTAVRRFVFVWIALTVVGTIVLKVLSDHLDLHRVWVAKPCMDIVLAACGFLLSRYWIYQTFKGMAR